MKDKNIRSFLKRVFIHKKAALLSRKIRKILKTHAKKEIVSEKYSQQKMEESFPFQSIPTTSYSIKEYISELENKLLPYSTNVATPKFIGHMTSVLPNFVPEIARLVTTLNQNVVKLETSQSATFYERQVIAMLHELFYNHDKDFYTTHIHAINSTLGIITSGGTIANLTTLQLSLIHI